MKYVKIAVLSTIIFGLGVIATLWVGMHQDTDHANAAMQEKHHKSGDMKHGEGHGEGHDDAYKAMHEKHHKSGEMNHGEGHGDGHGDGHGHASMKHHHDEMNMPGLQGRDTTEQEVADLAKIFRSHKGIDRRVVNLPNGIKTLTEAGDEDLRTAIVSHVSMMVTRLQEGKNPEVMIQSPTLDKLFDVYDQIETDIEVTELGVAVIQTSTNPDVVLLLQTHAAEVSDMSARGMAAVHERMMKDS
jgi:hypothetical protein